MSEPDGRTTGHSLFSFWPSEASREPRFLLEEQVKVASDARVKSRGLGVDESVELPDPSFANEFNVLQEDAIFVFDLRRATVSLPFQVHRLKVFVEVGLVAFSSACFEFADEVSK